MENGIFWSEIGSGFGDARGAPHQKFQGVPPPRGLKTKENFQLLAIKVVAVAYERWSLTRGSEYSDLTCKLLVVWKTGH